MKQAAKFRKLKTEYPRREITVSGYTSPAGRMVYVSCDKPIYLAPKDARKLIKLIEKAILDSESDKYE